MTSFDYLENVREDWIETPNFCRGGSSGVIKTEIDNIDVYIKKQTGHIFRSLKYPLGQPTALREMRAIVAMKKLGIRVPDIVHCESRRVNGKLRTYLVTRALEGYEPLDKFCANTFLNLDTETQGKLITALANMLALIHKHRWQHSALYPKHLFVRSNGENFDVALIDLESMRQRFTAKQASQHDLKQFSRHQPAWGKQSQETFLSCYQAAFSRN